MQKPVNLQDLFLNTARKEKIEVTAFLTNGFQLHGYVKAFDNFVVLFSCDGKQNLVYKHAIWNPRQFSMGLHYTEEMIPINADDKTFCINGKKICDIGEPDTDLPPYVKYYHDMIYNGGSWESGHFDENLDEREARETPDDFFMYSPYLDEKKGYIKWDLEGNELENTLE